MNLIIKNKPDYYFAITSLYLGGLENAIHRGYDLNKLIHTSEH